MGHYTEAELYNNLCSVVFFPYAFKRSSHPRNLTSKLAFISIYSHGSLCTVLSLDRKSSLTEVSSTLIQTMLQTTTELILQLVRALWATHSRRLPQSNPTDLVLTLLQLCFAR